MKATGLIVEYNPFHNGHLFHLQESKKQSQADVIVVVMSGHFTQRGEPTVINKWDRTKMALLNGADLVIELPYLYSCQSADLFATGSVSILTHLKVNELIFGSESGNILELQKLEALTRSQDFQNELKTFMNTGNSLPTATKKALESKNIPTALATLPNNSLGLYYMRAIHTLNSEIQPNTITRIHSGYHDFLPSHQSITSATSVRHLRETQTLYTDYVPQNVASILDQHLKTTNTYHNWDAYFPFLKQKILTLTPTFLETIHDVTEGIEHRIYASMLKASTYAQFMEGVKTKRYTTTRIQRICANILTHTTKVQVTQLNLALGAPYIRILGATPLGRTYLKQIKKEVTVPIYSKYDSTAHPILKHEQSVTAAYSCILPEPHCTDLNKKEYAQFPILIDNHSS